MNYVNRKEILVKMKESIAEATVVDPKSIAVLDALDTAIEAIDRQIPKKPLHMHKNLYCPVCREDGWLLWDDAEPNESDTYCGICGQKIDWSEQQ